MEVIFSPTFLRMLKALPHELQEEAIEKVALFHDPRHHAQLKVHKLKGRLTGRYAFSVNFRTRVVLQFKKIGRQRTAYLLAIGDHDVYR